jgi:hypothetical protein
MRIVVRADDGDQITVNADDLAAEQRIIRLELYNLTFDAVDDFESIAMTVESARELAAALLTIAEAMDDIETDAEPAPSHTVSPETPGAFVG